MYNTPINKKLIIVKIGGSVITKKNAPKSTPRLSVIKRLSKEIAKVYNSRKYKIILVHGGGSFGHPLAKRFNLQNGIKTNEQKNGFSQTSFEMTRLNQILLKELIAQKLPVVSIPPHSFALVENGRIQKLDTIIIKSYISQNMIPVLFGDVVFDSQKGSSILSGDTIVSYLARRFSCRNVIFLSDVGGIYDKDPHTFKGAKRIEQINNKNLKKVLDLIQFSNKNDVTGGMKGKVLSIKKHLKGVKVRIVNGLTRNNFIKSIGAEGAGTTLHFT